MTEKTEAGTEVALAPKTAVKKAAEMGMTKEQYASIRSAIALKNQMKWGQNLTDAELGAYEHRAHGMGLSVVDGDIDILGGKMYINLQGRLKTAHNSGTFNGIDGGMPEPFPKELWEDYGIPDDALFAFKATLWKKGYEMPFCGIGHSGGKRDQNQPVAKQHPSYQAQSRSLVRGLSLGWPTSLPSIEEGHIIDIKPVSESMKLPGKAKESLPEPPKAKSRIEVTQARILEPAVAPKEASETLVESEPYDTEATPDEIKDAGADALVHEFGGKFRYVGMSRDNLRELALALHHEDFDEWRKAVLEEWSRLKEDKAARKAKEAEAQGEEEPVDIGADTEGVAQTPV